jgi:hypothetical protein
MFNHDACRSLLTAAILNLAINARNDMPNGGTQSAFRDEIARLSTA